MLSPLRIIPSVALFFASAWTLRAVTLAPAGAVGADPPQCSMAIVQGQPAVAWVDMKNGIVQYVRALDATGSAWGAPVTLDTGSFFPGICLRPVIGNPAVCYFDYSLLRLKFIRAGNATGSSWNPPVTFGSRASYGGITMEVVNGNPAVAFPSENEGLKYIRALDADGTAWGPETVIDPQYTNRNLSMKVVEGNPAVAWPGGGAVHFVRASDDSGVIWGTRKSIRFSPDFLSATDCSLQIVDGRPAISFSIGESMGLSPSSGSGIFFTRSTDASGTVWPLDAELVVGGVDALLRHQSLEVINGKPAIAFLAGMPWYDLKLVRSADAEGSTWQSPLTLDSTGGTGDYPSLLMVAGNPAVAYSNFTPGSVKYLRAGGADGTLWPADILVGRQGSTVTIPDGGTAVFAAAAPGGTARFDFTLRNPNSGSEDLNITGMTIDGPDAAEFSVITPPVNAVAAGAGAAFTVQHAPSSPEKKSAVLHISSNAEEPHHLYDLILTNHAEPPVPGSRDPSFNPVLSQAPIAVAQQADGKIILASVEKSLLRLNSDGSPDNSFFPPSLDAMVLSLAVQKDGRILIGGGFTKVGGRPRTALARLLPGDGSLDESFDPHIATSDGASRLLIQPDGDILVVNFDKTERHELIRIHPDGSLDSAFNPRPQGFIQTLALQPDGKILVGGSFTEISSAPARGIARLHPDGTRDSFSDDFVDPDIPSISSITVQPDGRIIVAGAVTGGLARVFSDGQLNGSVSHVNNTGIDTTLLQADGKCLVSGTFEAFGGVPHRNLARMLPDGTVDAEFQSSILDPFGGLSYSLRSFMQADGRVLIFGFILGANGMLQPNFVRLENSPAFSLLQASGPSTVCWLRSGTAPEVRDVTFDAKPSGAADWTRLGTASRISGGWELSGLTLPATGTLRAQAYAGGSAIEETASILTPLESWRLHYFNTSASTGDAADDADPDHDGLTNFTEFAFGLSPVDRGSNRLPEFKYANNSLSATFTAPAGCDDVLYRAEWSATMLPGTWSAVPDTGVSPAHAFTIPATAPRVFVRYSVKMR